MKQIKWFDRTFEFSFEQNIFPSIIERLEGTSIRLNHKISQIPSGYLTVKHDENWSIQENIGHLIDLEPLWQGRLEDILNDKEYMRETDLTNRKTNLANHNEKDINQLLTNFINIREKTLNALIKLSEAEVYKYALHPRLKTPMRIMDLFLFVAEHDDHYMARISELNTLLTADNKTL
ncbi:DinB family protein [Flavivirga aquimarina]|uniref:DinB family protein n=1 Tax=Flavivirga aquimarina TaxID=2027862 RepID=A0ABT8WBQ8_9FLAO|nr:DinB family protein [Flavivirga aquimarina]MDO5970579.1 DinB family protein [Flavivirga aquimarina]